MKKLTIMLIFLGFISPYVWGNDLYQEYNLNKYNLDNDYIFHLCSKNSSSLQLNRSISLISENNNYCNNYINYSTSDIMVSFELKKKDPDSHFTVSFQGGINLGFQNEKRSDGSTRLKFRANIAGNYDWKFIKGEYKVVARILKANYFMNYNYPYYNINERIPYIGIEVTF